MPAQHGLGLRQRRQVLRGDEPLHGDGAQVDDAQSRPRLERLDRALLEPDTETRRSVLEAEKHRVARLAERARLRGRKQRIEAIAALAQHDGVAGNRIKADARVTGQYRQRGRVAAHGGRAFEAAARIGMRRGVRIWPGGCQERALIANCAEILGAKPGLIHFLPLRWRFDGIEAVTGREGQGGRQRGSGTV